MLSIIVSSYQEEYFNQFEKSVKDTIGEFFIYEIIKIQNKNQFSINTAYNKGAALAQYPNLLFIHEDIIFVTKNWGDILTDILNKENVGCIGLAGEDYESYVPSYWYSNPNKKCNIIQHIDTGKLHLLRVNYKENATLETIVSLDGVFIACTKEVYLSTKFDENLKGFHGYDYDFSVRVSRKYQNYVTSEILIEHASTGSFSTQWFDNLLFVRDKNGYKQHKNNIDRELELSKAYNLILLFSRFNTPKTKIILTMLKYLNPKYLGIKNCFKILNRLRYVQ